ncbi:MAG TPA: response regulator [Herpetosiphonaceae bacterium]|nr:response regulator [Herpetosiphonaceae bacterium]
MLHTRQTEACILIVDDEILNLSLLEIALQSAGFTNLHATTDSRQAVSLFTALRPDLVLTDFHMPGLDGPALIAEIRRREPGGPGVPVLVLTSDPTCEARQRAVTKGATEVLTKPFDLGRLLRSLDNHLGSGLPSANPTQDVSSSI